MKGFVVILNLYCWATMASAKDFGTEAKRPVPIDDLSKMNGTWEGYKKANVNLSLSCLSYNITCATKSQCDVTLIRTNPQDSGTTNYTIQQAGNNSIMVNEDLIFNIYLSNNLKYAVAWKDGDLEQLVVLLKDQTKPDDTTSNEIDDTIKMWNFTKDTVKEIEQCGTANIIVISPALVLLLVHFVIVSS